jgi:hypothetical protein
LCTEVTAVVVMTCGGKHTQMPTKLASPTVLDNIADNTGIAYAALVRKVILCRVEQCVDGLSK